MALTENTATPLARFRSAVNLFAMSTVLELHPGGTLRAEVAARLRQAIAARNVKKSAIAGAIGMNLTSFSKRVNGHIAVDVDEVDAIAAVAGINHAWLLAGVGPMLDAEWVPPAGFEPAAFCSGEPLETPTVGVADYDQLADVIPLRRLL